MDAMQTANYWIYSSYMTEKYGHGKEFSEKDMENVDDIREQFWPMKQGVRISSNIPVCGHQEQKNIYRCLSCFSKQKPETYKTFEVNLLVNSPEPTEDNEYSWEETKKEIERFKKEYPEIIVNVAYFRFQWEVDIGLLRCHLDDARMLEVSDPEKHLFVSQDADMVDMPSEYMERLPRLFQKPEHRLLATRINDSDDMLCYFPSYRIAGMLSPLLWKKPRKPSWGNMAFRVSAYEKIWWYRRTHGKVWEDGALAWAIRNNLGWMRQWNSAVTITSSARRKITQLLNNDGQRPEHGFWHSKWIDGSRVKNTFGHQEAYRDKEHGEDLTLLQHITSDENAWKVFLADLSGEMSKTLVSFLDKIEWNTIWKDSDKEDTHIPKKWNQAMKILWIEKWHISVVRYKFSKKIKSIDFQILKAETLKQKLKNFILSKEQKA